MKVLLENVSKGRKDRALPATTLDFQSATATLGYAETEQRPTVLGLIATGRMRPDSGRVLIDGRVDNRALRRSVALVDAPSVSEPEPNVPTAGVVAEELMFAGRRSDPLASRAWLGRLGLQKLAGTPIGNVSPSARLRILCELALLRRGVDGLVLVSPDRHGGEPIVWWRLAEELADRGYAMLVIAGRASHTALVAAHAVTTGSAAPGPGWAADLPSSEPPSTDETPTAPPPPDDADEADRSEDEGDPADPDGSDTTEGRADA